MNMKQLLMWKTLGFKALIFKYCFIVQELVKWFNLMQRQSFHENTDLIASVKNDFFNLA